MKEVEVTIVPQEGSQESVYEVSVVKVLELCWVHTST